MRIVYLYNGNPLNTSKIDETWGTSQGLAHQWKVQGHDVVEINFNLKDLNVRVENAIKEKKTDVILLSEAGTIPEHVKPIWQKSNFPGILMVGEGCDEPQILQYNLGHTMPADLVWSSDADAVRWYQSNGKNSIWIPHWGDEMIYSSTVDPCNGKISTSSGPRNGVWGDSVNSLVEKFGDNFVAPRIAGGPYLSPSSNNQLYANTSMVFQASSNGEITRRIFEACLAGRLTICDELAASKMMNQIFEVDKEILTFSNRKELIEKTEYYLSHHDERMDMAEKARLKCELFHTASKRAEQLIQIFDRCMKEMRI